MLVLRLAWRNAWRHARRTGILITAVAVGIAGTLLTMAVNFGMIFQMVETAITTELGHVQIHARGFDENPELAAAFMELSEEAFATPGEAQSTWFRMIGSLDASSRKDLAAKLMEASAKLAKAQNLVGAADGAELAASFDPAHRVKGRPHNAYCVFRVLVRSIGRFGGLGDFDLGSATA